MEAPSYIETIATTRKRRAELFTKDAPTSNASVAARTRLRVSNHIETATNFFVSIGRLLENPGDHTEEIRLMYLSAAQSFQEPFGRLLASNRCGTNSIILLQKQLDKLYKS